MTDRRARLALTLLLVAACGRKSPQAAPVPRSSAAAVDSLWALGEAAFNRGQNGAAQRLFDRLSPLMSAGDPRYLRLHFFQAEILFAQGSQLQSVREFRRVADERPDSPLAPDALLRAGDAYADLWRRAELDPTYGETARGVYQEVATRYEGTPAAARAAIRLAELGEKFAEKEYQSAVFYFKYKAWDSAILMFRSVVATYPRSAVARDALERLLRTYQFLGYQEDVKETCAYIAQYHPDPAGPRRLCPAATTPVGAAGPP